MHLGPRNITFDYSYQINILFNNTFHNLKWKWKTTDYGILLFWNKSGKVLQTCVVHTKVCKKGDSMHMVWETCSKSIPKFKHVAYVGLNPKLQDPHDSQLIKFLYLWLTKVCKGVIWYVLGTWHWKSISKVSTSIACGSNTKLWSAHGSQHVMLGAHDKCIPYFYQVSVLYAQGVR